MERNQNGTFKRTTGGGLYQRKQINGKNHQYHRVVWEENVGKIPKGFIVHHINGDKWDNRIDNLSLMTHTGHNNIHKHKAWNKGMTRDNSEKLNQLILNRMEVKKKNYLTKCLEAYSLRLSGKSVGEIAAIQGVCKRSVHQRIKEIKDGKYKGESE